MSRPNAHGVFTPLSPRIASLVVEASAGALGLTLDRRLQDHRLGLREAPAYRVAQPFSPDDGWVIAPQPNGRLLDENGGTPTALTGYAAWAAGSCALHGNSLIDQLPNGRYLVVRSPRRPIAAERVLLGNEFVEAPPNVQVLQDQPPVYACVIGAQSDSPPDLSQPLLGLAILNYVGESWMHGVVFFQLSASGDVGGDGRDIVLVIPADGELVIDNLGLVSPDGGNGARSRWSDEVVGGFAQWCADVK
jgi:hypothetical protein